MRSKNGKVVVRLPRLMDEFARTEDGRETSILADTKFDNHNKMTITGIVVMGTSVHDVNPLEDADRVMPRSNHYPAGYVGGGVFEVDIREGDRVWFHYLCAENRVSMERNTDGSWDVYMQTSDIFCIEREGKLKMNQNWVIGEEIRDSDILLVDALGEVKEEMLTPASGIELLKGFAIDTYVDEAMLVHIDACRYRTVHDEVEVGDRLYLAKDSCFPNVIHGKKRLLFRHTDILAVYDKENAKVIPVGENHLVRVLVNQYKSAVISHTVITRAPERAEIIASGDYCENAKAGDHVMFTRRWTRLLDKEIWLINDNEIQAQLK